MTDSLLRRARSTVVLAPLQRGDVDAARALCALNPIAYVMPAMHLDHAAATGRLGEGHVWVIRERATGGGGFQRPRGELIGVVWSGANLLTALPGASAETIVAVAEAMIARLARPSSLVGEAEVVLPLWATAERRWGPAREIRPDQWLMAIEGPPTHPAPPGPGDAILDALRLEALRPAELTDFDAVLPAAIHMFIGEVGYDPTAHGGTAYEDRLRRLIRLGRSFIQFGVVDGTHQVVFKAEAGVVGGGVAEIQGVWVHPSLRGRGFGRTGVAAVVDEIQASIAPTVSLYVNSYNAAAIAAYDAVGFTRVGTFATIMV